MRRKLALFSWKRQWLLDEPAPAPGGGGGTPPAGDPPPEPAKPAGPTAEELQGQLKDLQAKSAESEKVLAAMQNFYQQVAPHVEKMPDGTWKAKPMSEPSDDERAVQQAAANTAMQIQQLSESSGLAQDKVFQDWKVKDPFFEQNAIRAKEIMQTVALANRNEATWRRSYDLARGEKLSQYEKFYRDSEAEKVKGEISKSSNAAIIVSGGSAESNANEMKEQVKSFRWTDRLQRAADLQIRAGLIGSRDEYAELYLKNDLTNGGVQ